MAAAIQDSIGMAQSVKTVITLVLLAMDQALQTVSPVMQTLATTTVSVTVQLDTI